MRSDRRTSASRPLRRPARRDRAGGFVLLELVLALTILALLTALALPHVRLFDGPASLGLKAQEIAVLLRRDRDAARRSGRAVRTELELARRRIRSGALNGEVPVPPTVALRYAGREPAIRFAADGSASGGTLVLAGQRAGERFAVEVDDLTGTVTVTRGVRDAP